jgi:hypothetical protein
MFTKKDMSNGIRSNASDIDQISSREIDRISDSEERERERERERVELSLHTSRHVR